MKTAISVPDHLFHAADRLARKLGLSRSRLYATALAAYVAKHQASKVTERLNATYAAQPSRLDTALHRAQGRALEHSEW